MRRSLVNLARPIHLKLLDLKTENKQIKDFKELNCILNIL